MKGLFRIVLLGALVFSISSYSMAGGHAVHKTGYSKMNFEPQPMVCDHSFVDLRKPAFSFVLINVAALPIKNDVEIFTASGTDPPSR